ncbi:hypothetical protein AwMethylo_28360 [Methylobacterium sp.]|nr:hypothetical protein AwMethylo_28360 [Methylobacterium sp.]
MLITYMSTLASTEHAASQFGLLTSLCAFPSSVLAGFSGFIVERTGFSWFYRPDLVDRPARGAARGLRLGQGRHLRRDRAAGWRELLARSGGTAFTYCTAAFHPKPTLRMSS